MEYEKKYNEALEMAKYYHDRDNIQFLENIFPELKESEDERIRKGLIVGVRCMPYFPLACPSDGAFIGWKKVEGEYLVKLLIPEDAKRCSATGRRCRCSKAQVLDITTLDETEHHIEVTNTEYKPYITYKVGEVVLPDSFDEDRWDECSHGIHFFINKQDAIDY